MVYTPVSINDVKPSYGQRALILMTRFDGCCQLDFMRHHSRDGWQEFLLQIRVQIIVAPHKSQPPVRKDHRKQLVDGRGKSSQLKVVDLTSQPKLSFWGQA